jgi:hypothetical protein
MLERFSELTVYVVLSSLKLILCTLQRSVRCILPMTSRDRTTYIPLMRADRLVVRTS